MPGYPGNALAKPLDENTQKFLWSKEPVKTGESSVAFFLVRRERIFYPWGCSFEIAFTDANGNPADPGDFEIDIQIADSDLDSHYIGVAQITSANASFVGRYDLTNLFPKFVRANVVSITNAVSATMKVTR